jgi:hypothetical protein
MSPICRRGAASKAISMAGGDSLFGFLTAAYCARSSAAVLVNQSSQARSGCKLVNTPISASLQMTRPASASAMMSPTRRTRSALMRSSNRLCAGDQFLSARIIRK